MTRVPEFARGYRDGSRDLVTTMHRFAERCASYGAQASLNSTAHGMGVGGASVYEYISGRPGWHSEVLARLGRRSDLTRHRLDRDERARERLRGDAARLAIGPPPATRHSDPADYVHGYLEATEDGSERVLGYGFTLNDPPAWREYLPIAKAIRLTVKRLRAADRFVRLAHLHDHVERTRQRIEEAARGRGAAVQKAFFDELGDG